MARRAVQAASDEEDQRAGKRSRKKLVYDESDDDTGSSFQGSGDEQSNGPSRKSSDKARPSTSAVKEAAAPATMARNKRLTVISTPPRTPRGSLGSSNGGTGSADRKRLSVITRPGTLASGAAAGSGAGQNGAGTAIQAPRVSMEVMNNNFEEWMKLATDNKITATNTWNFALIDYFADLTLLRNGPDDQSINFQKASCTLDGCVKIWTSRVDSVATETGKLLSGLSSGGARDGEDEGGDPDDPDAEEDAARREKRKATRSEATLAKSFSQLQVKKFDLEFTVDPLFKKTCADFDEGGAMGLLMNHLGVDGKGRVVFDAGDVEDEEEDEEEGEEDEEDEEDLDMEKMEAFLPSLQDVASRNVSVTLSDFKFSSDPAEAFNMSVLGLGSDKDESCSNNDDDPPAENAENPGQGVHDFFGDDDGADYGGAGDFADFGGAGGGDDDNDGEAPFGVDGQDAVVAGVGALFDPRRGMDGKQLFVGMLGDEEGDGMMLDYFDQGVLKNWAGPEHWKLRKVTRKPDPNAPPTTARQARKEKTPFLIDFESPATVTAKEMFAQGPRPSIKSSRASSAASDGKRRSKGGKGAKKEEKRDEHLLPNDMHFSSRQLLRLFMKPKFTLKMRRQGAAAAQLQNADGDIDENFWAQAAAERAEIDAGAEDEAGLPIAPFESQFFHDDVDDGADFAEVDDGLVALTDGDEAGGGEAEDLWAGTQGTLRKSKPEGVHYAKKAKRVDVKRLKDNIWKGLDMALETGGESETESEASLPTVKDASEPRTFDAVIQNLRQSYPEDKMSEISTSFCFICLLHLANEQGLKIEPARLDDGKEDYQGEMEPAVEATDGLRGWGAKVKGTEVDERADRTVGELEALKIWKDPNAGKAA